MSDESRPPCRDFEHCGNPSDPRYTLDFTDVEPGAFIHFCATCGPLWAEVAEAIEDRARNEPGFAEKLEAEIEKVTQ